MGFASLWWFIRFTYSWGSKQTTHSLPQNFRVSWWQRWEKLGHNIKEFPVSSIPYSIPTNAPFLIPLVSPHPTWHYTLTAFPAGLAKINHFINFCHVDVRTYDRYARRTQHIHSTPKIHQFFSFFLFLFLLNLESDAKTRDCHDFILNWVFFFFFSAAISRGEMFLKCRYFIRIITWPGCVVVP